MLASSSLEIIDRRVSAQPLKQPEAPGTAGQAGDPALRVRHVAEDEGVGGAGLGAGRLHLAVPDHSAFTLCLFLGPADALDAEGALFHHPAAPHGDVRAELIVEG